MMIYIEIVGGIVGVLIIAFVAFAIWLYNSKTPYARSLKYRTIGNDIRREMYAMASPDDILRAGGPEEFARMVNESIDAVVKEQLVKDGAIQKTE
jgi:hypothetical protein